MIGVFNQWNMHGLTIRLPSWILQWKVVHMWNAFRSPERFGTISIQMLMRFLGSHCQISKSDDFSSDASSRSSRLIHRGVRYLQKAIMKLDYKQVNASFFLRSWHLSAEFLVPLVILLYLPPRVHFSFAGSTDTLGLTDSLPAWNFLKLFGGILQLGRSVLGSNCGLILPNDLGNRQNEAYVSAFISGMWEKSHPSSNWNVTVFLYISAAKEESHYSQLVFFGASLILLSVRTYRGPGGEPRERPISVIEATASSAARQENVARPCRGWNREQIK